MRMPLPWKVGLQVRDRGALRCHQQHRSHPRARLPQRPKMCLLPCSVSFLFGVASNTALQVRHTLARRERGYMGKQPLSQHAHGSACCDGCWRAAGETWKVEGTDRELLKGLLNREVESKTDKCPDPPSVADSTLVVCSRARACTMKKGSRSRTLLNAGPVKK